MYTTRLYRLRVKRNFLPVAARLKRAILICREITCCGPIFRGLYGEVIVDPGLLKRCVNCLEDRQRQRQAGIGSSSASTSPIHSASASPMRSVESSSPLPETSLSVAKQHQGVVSKSNTFSDASSDSGYDECSNQGVDGGKKNIQKTKLPPSFVEQMSCSPSLTTLAASVDPSNVLQSVSSID